MLSVLFVLAAVFLGPTLLAGGSSILPNSNTVDTSQKKSDILFPPHIDPIPEATNSGTFRISGYGQAGGTVILYSSGTDDDTTKIKDDGTYMFDSVTLKKGENKFTVAQKVDQTTSDQSSPSTILYKTEEPILEVTSPTDGAKINGDNTTTRIEGKTDEGSTLTINDRIVVVNSDGSFNYAYKMSGGDNHLKFVVVDIAGNKKELEITFTYEP